MTFRRRRLHPHRFRSQPLRSRNPAARAAFQRLRHAHDLMHAGKFQEAAQQYGALAKGAEKRRLPQAPQLFLQAGRAWFEAGDSQAGLACIQRGLNILELLRRFQRLNVIGSRIQTELNERGFAHEASVIGSYLEQIRKDHELTDLLIPREIKGSKLPANCPQCGGSVIPDQVERFEDGSAQCDYCGSVIQRARFPTHG